MMTMLHSVWSGGGSAAGRRRSLLALGALLALVASVLVWISPAQAQNQAPPIAIATVDADPDIAGQATLDGSNSFDPDGLAGSGTLRYKWEVVTEAYSWLALTDDEGVETNFIIPSAELAARYGQSIEFRLTVTDDDTPSASASDTVTYNINQRPTADIAVSANLEDKASDETGADRYTVDAVIDGPGENGNADNEWDIMEGALVVLDGTGSSDPNGRVTAYSWTRLHPASGAEGEGFAESGAAPKLSTDDAGTAVVETVDNLTATESPFYVYYRLNVTDSTATNATAGGTDPVAVVKIVVWDQPAAPKASLFATTIMNDPDTNDDEVADAMAKLTDGNPANNAEAYGELQKSEFPSDTPRWIVPPDTTITLDSSGTTDADDDDLSYEWEGAKKDSDVETGTRAMLKVDKDAEDGTVLTVTVTATDNSRGMLSGSASVEFLVVDDNIRPDASSGSGDDCTDDGVGEAADKAPVCDGIRSAGSTAGIQYITDDGAQGGDMKNGKSTGTVTFRGVGFDPDQPVGSLIYAWTELACLPDGSSNAADPSALSADSPCGPVDPDKAVLELDGALSDMVSFDVPEVDESTSVVLVFAVIDQHGVAGTDTVTIIINPADSMPSADAGSDQIVAPESFVRLNGAASSDPDKGDSIADYAWELTAVATSPATTEVLKSVADQVNKDLTAVGILPLVEDDDSDTGNNDGTCDSGETCQYGQPLTGETTPYPYFDAPKVANGIANIQLTFTLTVTDEADADATPPNEDLTDTDEVTITVTNRFFSGNVTGPNFCTNASLGGPRTYAFDSDGDGVADVCSLRTTRRATVARQNALTTLVAIGSTIGVEGSTENSENLDETIESPATFAELLIGRDGAPAEADDSTTDDVDESKDAVSKVVGTCDSASDKLGDSDADLAADACATSDVSGPPAPHDPATADVFFSGTITGPNFCTNLSLGGPRTYAFDSDDDGVADVCSLPYTRREAVARQDALEMFVNHPQYEDALAAACAALGTTDFGDSEAALAKDECNPEVQQPDLGDALPTPG